MNIVEYGEMGYCEVHSSDFDVDVILGEMDIDDLLECIKDEGTYVTVSYHVNVITPDRDEIIECEEEVFVEAEQAADRLAEMINQLQSQKSALWTQLREAQERILELERPTRYDISDITKGLMGMGS